jgi:hypothetical protein
MDGSSMLVSKELGWTLLLVALLIYVVVKTTGIVISDELTVSVCTAVAIGVVLLMWWENKRDREADANRQAPMTEEERSLAKYNNWVDTLRATGVPKEDLDRMLREHRSRPAVELAVRNYLRAHGTRQFARFYDDRDQDGLDTSHSARTLEFWRLEERDDYPTRFLLPGGSFSGAQREVLYFQPCLSHKEWMGALFSMGIDKKALTRILKANPTRRQAEAAIEEFLLAESRAEEEKAAKLRAQEWRQSLANSEHAPRLLVDLLAAGEGAKELTELLKARRDLLNPAYYPAIENNTRRIEPMAILAEKDMTNIARLQKLFNSGLDYTTEAVNMVCYSSGYVFNAPQLAAVRRNYAALHLFLQRTRPKVLSVCERPVWLPEDEPCSPLPSIASFVAADPKAPRNIRALVTQLAMGEAQEAEEARKDAASKAKAVATEAVSGSNSFEDPGFATRSVVEPGITRGYESSDDDEEGFEKDERKGMTEEERILAFSPTFDLTRERMRRALERAREEGRS